MIFEKEDILVSVIMTVYNRCNYVERAIYSVIKQSIDNFELIVVDDGSTDGSEKIIFDFFSKIDNLKYLRHSNRGAPLSMNTGINISSGKFITFLDSDDEYADNHLSGRIKYFQNNLETDLIHSSAEIIGNAKDYFVPNAEKPNELINIKNCIIGGTFFGKAEVFRKLKGFKDNYGYDYEFYKRAIKKFNVAKLDIPTYLYYRDTPDSVINIMKKKLLTTQINEKPAE